jgi:hypothetical protein
VRKILLLVFLLKFHTAPQKKEKKKISYLLLTQVTTRHFQKKFSGTPNINCLAPPLNRPKRGREKKKKQTNKKRKKNELKELKENWHF